MKTKKLWVIMSNDYPVFVCEGTEKEAEIEANELRGKWLEENKWSRMTTPYFHALLVDSNIEEK